MQPPGYLVDTLRAVNPELRLHWDHPRGAFVLTRKPFGSAREEIVRWLVTPSGGMVWPDWFNTVEGALEAQRWGEIGLDRALAELDDHNAGVVKKVEARASDRVHAELKPMGKFALKKGMRLLGPPRA